MNPIVFDFFRSTKEKSTFYNEDPHCYDVHTKNEVYSFMYIENLDVW